MTDRIELHYRKKCENSECENGIIHWDIDDIARSSECPDCKGEGYADEVIRFKEEEKGYYHRVEKYGKTLYINKPIILGEPIQVRRLRDNELITDFLKPINLVFPNGEFTWKK